MRRVILIESVVRKILRRTVENPLRLLFDMAECVFARCICGGYTKFNSPGPTFDVSNQFVGPWHEATASRKPCQSLNDFVHADLYLIGKTSYMRLGVMSFAS